MEEPSPPSVSIKLPTDTDPVMGLSTTAEHISTTQESDKANTTAKMKVTTSDLEMMKYFGSLPSNADLSTVETTTDQEELPQQVRLRPQQAISPSPKPEAINMETLGKLLLGIHTSVQQTNQEAQAMELAARRNQQSRWPEHRNTSTGRRSGQRVSGKSKQEIAEASAVEDALTLSGQETTGRIMALEMQQAELAKTPEAGERKLRGGGGGKTEEEACTSGRRSEPAGRVG